jgi:hypothetical protein
MPIGLAAFASAPALPHIITQATGGAGIGFGFSLETWKSGFFDRPGVIAAINKTTHRYLNRFGYEVAREAKRLMVDAPPGVYSPPGFAPFAHSGLLRKMIYWAFDVATRSLVVGPSALKDHYTPYTNFMVPELLEYGGTAIRKGRGGFMWQKYGQAIPIYHYEPRPYMGPALTYVWARNDLIWDRAISADLPNFGF